MKKNFLFLSLFAWMMTIGVHAVDHIGVTSPAYCSEIQGNTTINIVAPSIYPTINVHCWKQGSGQGTYTLVGTVEMDENGMGSIVFPADEYPHGPLTIRISSKTSRDNKKDCYLQLYNKGGVSWKEGIPSNNPPAAAGMKLIFADDFDSELSIGSNSSVHTYYDHKPPHGSQDFSFPVRFTDFYSVHSPFKQVGTYLRIRANANTNTTGLISSFFSDNTGISASVPCYFECRFVGPNAPGSWPAFWLLSKKDNINDNNEPCDELDIIEAYGNMSERDKQIYRIAAHPWSQTGEAEQLIAGFYEGAGKVDPYKFGILSTWFDVPHTYGCKITEDFTIYYCDDIEVARHATLPISKSKPLYFLINLATGGGWPVDLSRYNGIIDMYVDYVRVYEGYESSVSSLDQSGIDMKVYPNPVSDQLTVSLNTDAPADVFVSIYNTLGQRVSSHQQHQQGEITIPVDMSNMSNGIYMTKVNVGNTQVSKLIIKK